MKKIERDSQKRIAFVQLFAEASSSVDVPDEIHVVPTGAWSHPVYGEMEITSADVAEFVQNFKDKVRKDLRITAGHDNGMSGGELPAIGWFKELIDRGVKGLYAVVEWNDEGKKLLTDRAYKYFSPEFYEEYLDPETGEKRTHVLVGGALTNMPYFKELDPVVAFSEPRIINQFNDTMDLKTILAKKVEDLSADEKAFVREHKAELDAGQQSTFESVLNETPAETDEEKAAREAKEAEDKAAADAAAEAERQASERNKGTVITMSVAEAAALREQANKGAKAFAEIEKMKLDKEVEKLVFSASNAEGRILPRNKEAIVSFMLTLSEKQRGEFRNILSGLPKADKTIFSEIGDGGKATDGSAASLYSEIKGLVDAKVAASAGKLSFSDGLLQVYAEKPELKTSYEAALATEGK